MTDVDSTCAPLFTDPLQLGSVTFPNRVFFCPTSVGYAADGVVTPQMLAHYRRRAAGGVGAVMTEHLAVDPDGWQHRRQPAAWPSTQMRSGLQNLAAAIHAEGSPAIAQISHAGRYAGPWDEWDRKPRLAASAVPFPLLDRTVVPCEITTAQIQSVISAFAATTRMLMDIGWDGVEIHAGSGLLLSGFLSPRSNRRNDRYGGAAHERVRLLEEVVHACSEQTADRGCVGVHLLVDELVDDGLALADSEIMIPHLEAAGANFLRPSAGTFETLRLPGNAGLMSQPDCNRAGTDMLLRTATVPVIANGGLHSRTDVASALARGAAAVALARPLLADPDWLVKMRAGADTSVVECPCRPPACLQTQLGGAICAAWPEAVRELGHSGDIEQWCAD